MMGMLVGLYRGFAVTGGPAAFADTAIASAPSARAGVDDDHMRPS
jgi:hypothetical protein